MTNFSVTQFGKVLNPSKYNWDEETRVFSTNENNLVLDFSNENHVTFKTGSYCTFTTGSSCIFTTGDGCTFKTGSYCTFTTDSSCTFTSGKDSVVIRRDIFEVIQLVEDQTIKLNDYQVTGYVVIEEKKEDLLEKLQEKLKNLSVEDLKKFLSS